MDEKINDLADNCSLENSECAGDLLDDDSSLRCDSDDNSEVLCGCCCCC